MSSLHFRSPISVSAETGWDFLLRYTRAEVHVFSICTDEWLESDTRVVRLADGQVIRERNVTIDSVHMRAAYAIPGAHGSEYHHAEMRIYRDPDGGASLEWITDYLPHALVDRLVESYTTLFDELVERVNQHDRQ